ncbi:MAG: mandelate racemase/muconate lactonizing enzyme family protein [Geminicoccaceae bacterium]|nr:mandelate racemase/muconate lactonizing enzyme family protein [Geminicoccaceae bacterium]
MKIQRISVFAVDLPYVDGAYGFARRRSLAVADSTVVRIDTDDGITGWGECCPLGACYLPAFAEGLRAGIARLAPCLIGRDPTRIGALLHVMDRELQGHPYVKSAIDIACHDILGKASGLPVHALLGGRQNDAMPTYRSIGQNLPEVMTDLTARYREQGYRQFQLKVGGEVADDVVRIRRIVEAKRAEEIVLCDANRGWRKDEAVRVAQATRDLDFILEQPCDAYADCLSVRRRASQPFKLDESLKTLDDVLRALSDDAMEIACIKVSKHGGLAKARLVRDVCAAQGVAMTVEDTWGGEIVTAALAHLAVSTPSERLLNTTDLHNYNTVHFASGAPENRAGDLYVGDPAGLGLEVDEERLGVPFAVIAEA